MLKSIPDSVLHRIFNSIPGILLQRILKSALDILLHRIFQNSLLLQMELIIVLNIVTFTLVFMQNILGTLTVWNVVEVFLEQKVLEEDCRL